MKLLFCETCWDIFKLDTDEMRSCKCGKVKGRYLDTTLAINNGMGISLAIGNGSLLQAIQDMSELERRTGGGASRSQYHIEGNGLIGYAWARPNEGIGNPHSKVTEII